jgi:protein-disulfide isomerase
MKDKPGIFFEKVLSNPLFFLIVIIAIFAALVYFFGGKEPKVSEPLASTYSEDSNWKNTEYFKGQQDAAVVIVEYGDYQCPACGRAFGVAERIIEEYKDKEVKFVYRHFPLSQHKFAFQAAVAAECAGEQGRFWEMHSELYKNQRDINERNMKKFAVNIGIEADKFNQCFDNNGYADKINKQKEQGKSDNIRYTPTFFINGSELSDVSVEGFRKAIDSELNKNQ